MADITYHLAESQLENGTIDFYTLLDELPDSDSETLRSKIGAIYNYASANRDHRNLNKRREFQALLELLPAARIALLEEPKRARYDAYLTAACQDNAEVDFETFMNDLLGNAESDADKTSLLGVQEKKQPGQTGSRVIKAPAPPVAAPTPRPTAPAGNAMLPIFGGVGGFALGLLIGFVIFKAAIPALLIGVIIAAIAFVVLNKTPGGRIGT